jgi:hypothetical protein
MNPLEIIKEMADALQMAKREIVEEDKSREYWQKEPMIFIIDSSLSKAKSLNVKEGGWWDKTKESDFESWKEGDKVKEEQEELWADLGEKVKNNQWFAGDLYNYMKKHFHISRVKE